jgi:hypothetical protein
MDVLIKSVINSKIKEIFQPPNISHLSYFSSSSPEVENFGKDTENMQTNKPAFTNYHQPTFLYCKLSDLQ